MSELNPAALTPPLNGSYRQWLAWLLGLLAFGVVLASTFGAGRLINHETRITVAESRTARVEQRLDAIDDKLDQILMATKGR